jgi:hypothetical protein
MDYPASLAALGLLVTEIQRAVKGSLTKGDLRLGLACFLLSCTRASECLTAFFTYAHACTILLKRLGLRGNLGTGPPRLGQFGEISDHSSEVQTNWPILENS